MRDFTALLFLLCGSAVRGLRSNDQTGTDSAANMGFTTSNFIGGIPVYNYEKFDPPEPEEGSASFGIAAINDDADPQSNERKWIVMMRKEATDAEMKSLCDDEPHHERCSAHGDPDRGGVGFLSVVGSESYLESIVSQNASEVDYIEPDGKVRAFDQGNTSLAAYDDTVLRPLSWDTVPWGLKNIQARSKGNLGRGVHVYVMDTGVRHSHPDFEERAIPTLDINGHGIRECLGRGHDNCANDVNGHGTHCAGTIAGRRYGVAKQAWIHSVKVLGNRGDGSLSWILQGLDWITRKAVFPAVVSMSLGSAGTSPAERSAVRTAVRAGIPVVVAAGNANEDACGFSPAAVAEAITVGSFDVSNRKSSFSCYGRCVDIWAPGSDIVSASPFGGSTSMSGTSMACPHVSGAAALILGDEPRLPVREVRRQLLDNAVRNRIRGLRAYDTNLALSVSFAFAGSRKETRFPEPNFVYAIRAVCSSLFLGVRQSSKLHGKDVIQWASSPDELGQKFTFSPCGDGYFFIVNKGSGLYLDVRGSQKAGTKILQWKRLGTDNQKWKFQPLRGGQYSIISKFSGMAMAIGEASKERGKQLIQWYLAFHDDSQKFEFRVQ